VESQNIPNIQSHVEQKGKKTKQTGGITLPDFKTASY
jgi:hypothetical protein